MPDHAHYIHTVARVMSAAGFHVRSVGGHDWQPRGGHILLGVQDDWDSYDDPDADVRWDEDNGWSLHHRGMTEDFGIGRLPKPARVVSAVAVELGITRTTDYSTRWPEVGHEPSRAEFDAALAAYEPERSR